MLPGDRVKLTDSNELLVDDLPVALVESVGHTLRLDFRASALVDRVTTVLRSLAVQRSESLGALDKQVTINLADNAGGVSKPYVVDLVETADFPRWNPTDPHDTNYDAVVSPIDALIVINQLNETGSRDLSGDAVDRPFYDANRDNFVSPLDALVIINHINDRSASTDEPEAESALHGAGAAPTNVSVVSRRKVAGNTVSFLESTPAATTTGKLRTSSATPLSCRSSLERRSPTQSMRDSRAFVRREEYFGKLGTNPEDLIWDELFQCVYDAINCRTF